MARMNAEQKAAFAAEAIRETIMAKDLAKGNLAEKLGARIGKNTIKPLDAMDIIHQAIGNNDIPTVTMRNIFAALVWGAAVPKKRKATDDIANAKNASAAGVFSRFVADIMEGKAESTALENVQKGTDAKSDADIAKRALASVAKSAAEKASAFANVAELSDDQAEALAGFQAAYDHMAELLGLSK